MTHTCCPSLARDSSEGLPAASVTRYGNAEQTAMQQPKHGNRGHRSAVDTIGTWGRSAEGELNDEGQRCKLAPPVGDSPGFATQLRRERHPVRIDRAWERAAVFVPSERSHATA